MKCGHCPSPGPCMGERADRLCQLADPAHPDHDPAYVAKLSGEAAASPGLLARAANFASSVGRHVAHGMPQAGAAEEGRRLAVCLACPRYLAESGTCGACGCVLRVKASWALESCPEGRW